MFPLDEFEIVSIPVPENETPREMVQRMTGHDFPNLGYCTWEYIREYEPMQKWLTRVLAILGKPQVIAVKKKNK